MRPRIDWMTRSDDRILEFLAEKEILASPSVIAINIDYNPSYISRRCRKLAAGGLLNQVEKSNYQLTDLGERYLSGEIDPDDVEIDNGDGES